MRRTSCILSALALGLLTQKAALAGGAAMDCTTSDRERLAVLKQAPSGAKRLDKRTLQVAWKGGKHLFKDQPPFDEPLDGVRWSYCAFDAGSQLHLIEKDDSGLFTGVLLSEATGAVVEAGNAVVISPDRKRYFATRQPDGMDGEEWLVYSAEGKAIWKGNSFIADAHDSILAELSAPTWSADGKLQATLVCLADQEKKGAKKVTVTLENGKGAYHWSPEVRCPGLGS